MAQRTPLYLNHQKAGARLVEFAGFEMPLQYSGLLSEHEAVRTRVGLFDVSHMGEVVFRGPRAVEALGRLFTNDLGRVVDGQAQYGCLCREDGGIVDDVVVYRRAADDLLVCVNAANRKKDFEWLAAGVDPRSVSVRDESEAFAQLALQGPLSAQLLQRLTNANLSALRSYRFAIGEVAGVPCLVSRTGYTGEDGFEIFCPPDKAPLLWDEILEAGRHEKVEPCGLGARDSLRLEMAYRLYGADMDERTTPLEAGLSWVVKLEKGDFVGRGALARQKEQGIVRKLVGFVLTDPGIARHGYPALQEGQRVGEVTSGTRSPTLGTSVGLAYLPPSLGAEGATFAVEIRGRPAAARIVKTPFYTRSR